MDRVDFVEDGFYGSGEGREPVLGHSYALDALAGEEEGGTRALGFGGGDIVAGVRW